MDPNQLHILNRIEKILYHDWNPIGIPRLPQNEYSSYALEILRLKRMGANQIQIAEYLYKLETQSMKLLGSMEYCKFIAGKILEI
jgi:hypothetical protein